MRSCEPLSLSKTDLSLLIFHSHFFKYDAVDSIEPLSNDVTMEAGDFDEADVYGDSFDGGAVFEQVAGASIQSTSQNDDLFEY